MSKIIISILLILTLYSCNELIPGSGEAKLNFESNVNNQANDNVVGTSFCEPSLVDINILQPSFSVSSGEPLHFDLVIGNKNKNCSGNTFIIQTELPSNWRADQVPTSLEVTEGQSQFVSSAVTYPGNVIGGDYSIKLSVFDRDNPQYRNEVIRSVSIRVIPECIKAAPSLVYIPNTFSGDIGDVFNSILRVKNNDQNCPVSSFAITHQGSAELDVNSQSQLSLSSGASQDIAVVIGTSRANEGSSFVLSSAINGLNQSSGVLSLVLSKKIEAARFVQQPLLDSNSLTHNSARLSWTLDKALVTNIAYGLSANALNSQVNVAASVSQQIELTNLQSSTQYFMKASFTDQGRLVESNLISFTTKATPINIGKPVITTSRLDNQYTIVIRNVGDIPSGGYDVLVRGDNVPKRVTGSQIILTLNKEQEQCFIARALYSARTIASDEKCEQAEVSRLVITKQPVSQTFMEGQTSTITVEADGVASYQWQVRGGGGFRTPATNQTTKTLTLVTRPVDNGGVWRCQLTGENGEVIVTNEVTLNVTPAPEPANLLSQSVRSQDIGKSEVALNIQSDIDTRINIRYGLSSTQLNQQLNQTDYMKLHNLKLTGLTQNQEYYYQIVLTTRDSLVTTSDIYRFTNTQAPEQNEINDPNRAFPNAYGGGSRANANHGGVLVIVNTLDYSTGLTHHPASNGRDEYYTGGFKAAVEENIGSRYIVFNVSGNIIGNARTCWGCGIFASRADGQTIFGQSAPRGGITLNKSWLHYSRGNNIIVRYLRVRTGMISGTPIGDDRTTVPILLGAQNSIVDHCSVSWGGDKGLIMGDWVGGHPMLNITASRNFVADSATQMFSVDGINEGNDWNASDNISWIYNLSMGGHRTPNVGGGNGNFEIQNNVIQLTNGSRLANVVYGNPLVNHVGNYMDVYHNRVIQNKFQSLGGSSPRIHTSLNYYRNASSIFLTGMANEDNRSIWGDFSTSASLPSSRFQSQSFYGDIPNPAPLLSAVEARDNVLQDVGANKYLDNNGEVQVYQDSYDEAAFMDFMTRTFRFREYSTDWALPTLPSSQRPANFDSDNDGLADAWEMRVIGNLNQSYRGDHDNDGVLNINEYMNQVDL